MAGLDIGILLYEGFDELDAVIPHAVFDRAAAACDLSVTTYSLVPSQTVTAASGLELAPDDVLIGTPDLVIVPGGPWDEGTSTGARAAAEAGEYPDRLANLAAGDTTFAALSTGVLLLGEAGLLDDRDVACHHAYRDHVREYGATIVAEGWSPGDAQPDPVLVTDGDVVTAGGAGSAFDLALHVVEAECGADRAAAIADALEVRRP